MGFTLRLQDHPAKSSSLKEPTLTSGGGLVSTAHDDLRLDQMLLNRGELDRVRILQPATVDLMTQNHLLQALQDCPVANKPLPSCAIQQSVSTGPQRPPHALTKEAESRARNLIRPLP